MAELNDHLMRAEAERDCATKEVKGLTGEMDAAHAAVEEARKLVESGLIELAVLSAEVAAQSNELSEARRELAAAHTELARIRDVLHKL